ncbi:MAG TPA: hypothetical protein PLI86_02975 [bacterium]|nr:hypothetical protein [bacterium]
MKTEDRTVHPTPAASRLLAALKAAALCLALGAAAGAADTITLKNGGTLKCKVIRETKELVKVRMPRRGKIVTTFLNRGAVESIATTSDIENRRLFQSSGVRNPAKNFEPVYYSGIRTAAAGGKPGLPGGKPTMKTTARGIEARQKASEERAKARSARGRSGASAAAEPSAAPIAPVTTGGAGTSMSTGISSGS